MRLRLRSLAARRSVETELDQELAFHLAEQKAEYMRLGLPEAEAEMAARRSFGNLPALAESCRDERHTRWLEDFASDIKFAVRSLRRSPGFTCAAIATLALASGVNLAFFAAAHAVLLRPLPYPEPERIVEVELGINGVGPTTALREMAQQADYAGYLPKVDRTVRLDGETARLQTATVTWNLARVLGVQPVSGRWFTAQEEAARQPRAVVLSHRLWRQRFGAGPNVIGQKVLIDEEPHEVVGIMPRGFDFPSADTAMWLSIRADPSDLGYLWGSPNLQPIGRLAQGATLASAHSEMRSLVDRVRPLFPWRMPDSWGTSSNVIEHKDALTGGAKPKLLALAAASLLLLMIGCGNVANLLLIRWVARDREFAVREALGAGRGRLLRQVVAENLVLATAGAVTGVGAAAALTMALPALLGEIPRLQENAATSSLGLLAAGVALLTFAFLSVAPVFRKKVLGESGASGSRSTSAKRSSRTSFALAVLQLSLTTALLIGAGLMARTLWRLADVESGLHAETLLAGSVSAGPARCPSPERCGAFLDGMASALSQVPGVRSVNWSNGIPFTRKTTAMSVDLEGHPRDPGAPAFVLWHVAATPGYFNALGIHLRSGRTFSSADHRGALPVAIISESTARKFWPGESPLGKTIRPVSRSEGRVVIGVVADVAHHSLDGYPAWIDGVQYVPVEQALPVSRGAFQYSVFIESAGTDSAVLQQAVQQAVRQTFPDTVITGLRSLRRVRDDSVSNRRSTAWLMSLLAALGLLIGIVGVYGTLSQRAAQRRPEIGVRMALGATPGHVAGVVLKEALAVGAVGGALGAAGALLLTRFLRTLLFGVTATDPVAFAAGTAALVVTALLAAVIPAVRSARIDPAKVLRSE